MKRFMVMTLLSLIALLWLAEPVMSQGISQLTITMSGKGARFRVDGRDYDTKAAFVWPAGSKHILEFPVSEDGYQYTGLANTRFLFSSWTDNTGLSAATGSSVYTVTADPAVHSIVGALSVEHLVQLVLFEGTAVPPATKATTSPSFCGGPGAPPPSEFRPGVVFVGGTCYWNNVQLWMTEGTANLNVFPYPGFVFLGWKAHPNPPSAFLRTVTITGPTTLIPRFSSAKRVNFRTDPPGLRVLVDRQEIRTTEIEPCEPNNYLPPGAPAGIKQPCVGEFDFAPGSTHVLGATSPQIDKVGRTWLFDTFSNGMTQNATYTTSHEVMPEETIVGRFVPGVSASFITKPTGLRLSVDNRENWPAYHFVFAPNSKHTVSAPAEQVDARGRKYVFRGWSNGGAQDQEITIPPDAVQSGFSLTAEYELLSQVTVRSNAAIGTILVDGSSCSLPCRIDRKDGSEIRLAAPEASLINDAQRFEFASWSNGGTREQAYTLSGADSKSLNVNFRIAYKLAVAAEPAEAANFQVDPETVDMFYPADSLITIAAQEKPGFKFRRWEWDLTSASRISTVVMTGPKSIVAKYEKVPFIAPAGIKNAAGVTPEGVVAPGSLINISGADLSASREVGPQGPILSQALAGTTVMVGNRILPLMMVSPEMITAQLPRDLPAGEYELRVHRLGQQPIPGKFNVVRSAPGVFSQSYDGQSIALGNRQDGSSILPTSGVPRGEEVTLLGTGFGAYTLNHPEGFALPANPSFPLALEAEVWAGEQKLETVWAGGNPGQIGIDALRLKIPQELPDGTTHLQIKVRIDGRDSNTVVLPVQ